MIIKTLKESEIQSQIRDYLRFNGWFCIKIHQSLGSYKGIADLYCLHDGKELWIEVKTSKGKLSEYQIKFRDDIGRNGGNYIVARSLEDVREYLKAV